MISVRAAGVREILPEVTRTSKEVLSSKTGISNLPVGQSSPERVSMWAAALVVRWNMTLRISVLTPCPVAAGVAEAAGVSVEDGGMEVAGAVGAAFCCDVCSLGGVEVLEQAARVKESSRAGMIVEFFTEPRCSGRSCMISSSGLMVHGFGDVWLEPAKRQWWRDFRANCDGDDIPSLVKMIPTIVTSSCKKKYFLLGAR